MPVFNHGNDFRHFQPELRPINWGIGLNSADSSASEAFIRVVKDDAPRDKTNIHEATIEGVCNGQEVDPRCEVYPCIQR